MTDAFTNFQDALLARRVASRVMAMEFPTEDAKKKYLKDHPGARPSDHSVKKSEPKGEGKSEPESKKPSKEDRTKWQKQIHETKRLRTQVMNLQGELQTAEGKGDKREISNAKGKLEQAQAKQEKAKAELKKEEEANPGVDLEKEAYPGGYSGAPKATPSSKPKAPSKPRPKGKDGKPLKIPSPSDISKQKTTIERLEQRVKEDQRELRHRGNREDQHLLEMTKQRLTDEKARLRSMVKTRRKVDEPEGGYPKEEPKPPTADDHARQEKKIERLLKKLKGDKRDRSQGFSRDSDRTRERLKEERAVLKKMEKDLPKSVLDEVGKKKEDQAKVTPEEKKKQTETDTLEKKIRKTERDVKKLRSWSHPSKNLNPGFRERYKKRLKKVQERLKKEQTSFEGMQKELKSMQKARGKTARIGDALKTFQDALLARRVARRV